MLSTMPSESFNRQNKNSLINNLHSLHKLPKYLKKKPLMKYSNDFLGGFPLYFLLRKSLIEEFLMEPLEDFV